MLAISYGPLAILLGCLDMNKKSLAVLWYQLDGTKTCATL